MKSSLFVVLSLFGFLLVVSAQDYGVDVNAFVCAVNKYRASRGLSPLGYDMRLCNACAAHSADMASHNDLEHNGSNGSGPGDRFAQYGITGVAWAENIADGFTSIDSVMQGWINSPGHRANLEGDYTVVCGARVGNYWTQDFAKLGGSIKYPTCDGSPAPNQDTAYQSPTAAEPTIDLVTLSYTPTLDATSQSPTSTYVKTIRRHRPHYIYTKSIQSFSATVYPINSVPCA